MAGTIAGVLFATSACTGTIKGDRTREQPGSASFANACSADLASIQERIFQPSCAECHSGTEPAGNLDLTKADLAAELVNVSAATCDGWARVVPGSPEKSFLIDKLVSAAPACGDVMPLTEHLDSSQVECIEQWIAALGGGACETCGGTQCVALTSDPLNCGSCGTQCPAGVACLNGACACGAGRAACAGSCVDVQNDPANCGACGIACSSGSSCVAGACTCAAGLTSCGGTCVDLHSDGQHCGACNSACASGQVCLLGQCTDACGSLTQCGTSCVDVTSSATHCGACNNSCAAGLACQAGHCVCPGGATQCGTLCVDTTSDENNCGACGKRCGAGEACTNGVCACTGSAVSLSATVLDIFTRNCTAAGCHSGRLPKEGLSLEAGSAYDELVNIASSQCGGTRKLVVPFKPSESYLMQKLLNIDLCTGSQMPKAGQSLSQSELDAISGWICAGAQRN